MISRYTFFGGRRRAGRRPGESDNIYVDRYDPRIVAVFLLILALNVLDAYFTLLFIQRGGTEANPIAQWFLDLGTLPFILVKSAAIGAFLLVLVLHKTFMSVPRMMTIVMVFYTVLLVYHLALQLTVVPRM